ncbi:exosporium leader peptide-containing protein, partial [Bacillus toyonensis]
MSNEKYLNSLRREEFLFACAIDPNLVGPTLSPIPPFTLPTGPQGA